MTSRPDEPFETTCPLFGTAVTQYPVGDDSRQGGDYITLKGDDGYYCIAGTVAQSTDGLTDDQKERLRAWLNARRGEGEDYPMITTDVICRIRE